ncbi:extracellular superoxide dismutase [Pimephales promelas]|nr:extracellular superoxide dismutase [Pimephales promelas]
MVGTRVMPPLQDKPGQQESAPSRTTVGVQAIKINMEKMVLQIPLILLVLHIQGGELTRSPVCSPIAEAPQPEVVEFNNTIYATCEVTPSPNLPPSQPKIFGQILFKQVFPDGVLEVKVNLLPAGTSRACH